MHQLLRQKQSRAIRHAGVIPNQYTHLTAATAIHMIDTFPTYNNQQLVRVKWDDVSFTVTIKNQNP